MSKTWLITGASSGFGRLLAETVLARGDRIVATVRTPQALADLQARYGDAATVLQLDVRDFAAVHAAMAQAFAALGRIDVVVSNAGYGTLGAAEAATEAQVRAIIDTNLIGSIALIQAVLPRLRQQGGGHVVQVSSEGGQIAYPGFSLYHASKWGIEGFVEAVQQEVAGFGIHFTLAEPGPARPAPISVPPWCVPTSLPTTPTRRSGRSAAHWTMAAGSLRATRNAWSTR